MATTFADHLLGPDTHANRPTATAVPSGTLYSCTDHSIVYQSDGSTWSDWGTLGEASSVLVTARNESGVGLTKGDAVYISGYSVGSDVVLVDLADASASGTMPCLGLVFEDIANNATGQVMVQGTLEGVDTSSFTTGDELYVSTTAGELTTSLATNGELVQRVGEVLRSHASEGIIDVDRARVVITGFVWTLLDDGGAATARATLGAPALTPTVNTVPATGAAEDIDFGTEAHDLTMDQNCAFSFTNPPASGDRGKIEVIVRGAFTPTWPASVDWPGGVEPTYAAPTLYTFVTVDGGTTVLGSADTGLA